MALWVPSRLVISVSFMEPDGLDQLLQDVEFDFDDQACLASPASSASSAPSPTSSIDSSCTPKRIRPDLDPLPLPLAESRTEYFTVNDYVWPTPKKRVCSRMPDEERRQRHRESQRDFMTRKREQFQAMRAEIGHLERRVRWLENRQELTMLTLEQQSLQARLGTVAASIQDGVWKVQS